MIIRYRLRTLLIVLALGPPRLAGAWVVGKPIVDDYWFLRNEDSGEYYERTIRLTGGPVVAREPRGFHPIAEFLNRVLP